MTLAPDRTGYHAPHEVDDAPFVDLVSTHRDATHPVVEPLTVREAENSVLYHVQQWYSGEVEDLGLAYCCACADLGARVPEKGFRELAEEYREPMTPAEADTWTQQLTDYISDWKA